GNRRLAHGVGTPWHIGPDGPCRRPVRGYRALLLERSYPGAAIGYAPVAGAWLVLSGTLDGRILRACDVPAPGGSSIARQCSTPPPSAASMTASSKRWRAAIA